MCELSRPILPAVVFRIGDFSAIEFIRCCFSLRVITGCNDACGGCDELGPNYLLDWPMLISVTEASPSRSLEFLSRANGSSD